MNIEYRMPDRGGPRGVDVSRPGKIWEGAHQVVLPCGHDDGRAVAAIQVKLCSG